MKWKLRGLCSFQGQNLKQVDTHGRNIEQESDPIQRNRSRCTFNSNSSTYPLHPNPDPVPVNILAETNVSHGIPSRNGNPKSLNKSRRIVDQRPTNPERLASRKKKASDDRGQAGRKEIDANTNREIMLIKAVRNFFSFEINLLDGS